MNAPPAFANDWISCRPGRPRSACSCGSISSDSTSVGAAARQPVKTVIDRLLDVREQLHRQA